MSAYDDLVFEGGADKQHPLGSIEGKKAVCA